MRDNEGEVFVCVCVCVCVFNVCLCEGMYGGVGVLSGMGADDRTDACNQQRWWWWWWWRGREGGVQWKKNARVMGGGGGEGWVEEVVRGGWRRWCLGWRCSWTFLRYHSNSSLLVHLPTWVISSSFLISSFFTPSEYCSRNISRFRAT